MTGAPIDTPIDEIDWTGFFARCVVAESWPAFRNEAYSSGVLLSHYHAVLDATDIEGDELLEWGTVKELRALFTQQIRKEYFTYGSGDHEFLDGILDETLEALAHRLGLAYDTPRRVLPCPTCGDRARIQTVVIGLPAGPPSPKDEDHYYFAGCTDDGSTGEWFCPTCDSFYSVPFENPFRSVNEESGAAQGDIERESGGSPT
ncbi:MAG: nuclease A inhibitor family protein [Acidimicrobiia bacterium]|nr:nuclease A inhibitor family protein [Acidimicrobiia bacterium]